jgi:hypothetical protein
MNVQTNKLAQAAQGERLCGSCGQPWFGSVAYCPYCGKPSFAPANRQPDARPQDEKAVARGQGDLGISPGEFHLQEDEPSPTESRRKLIPDLPIFDKDLPAGQDKAPPSPINRSVLAILFTVAAVVGALLFWMLVKLPAPRTEAEAPSQLPISGTASPTPGPSTGAAPVRPVPARTETAAPPPAPPARTETAVPSPSTRGALCSPANEAAGLCKPQR